MEADTRGTEKGNIVTARDDRHRDIVDKLGIKPGHAVVFAAHAQAIDPVLVQRIINRTGRPAATADEAADIVLAAVDETTDIVEVLDYWKRRLQPNGGIWLLTAKRGQSGYVDQRDLITAGKLAGVVDNKICSVSTTTSAMRFVIRRSDRSA